MSTAMLLFVHGWGFGPGVWDPLGSALPEFRTAAVDLGYFGPPRTPSPAPPVLVVAHSLGAMLALRAPPPGCLGLVALNGFDRFAETGDASGVPRRTIERMIAKFDVSPNDVIAEFRRRCGVSEPFDPPDKLRLREHLCLLRDGDERTHTAEWSLPLLSLQGGRDPILPLALRKIAFSRAGQLQSRVHPEAGHLLPATHPAWCAARIRELLGSVA